MGVLTHVPVGTMTLERFSEVLPGDKLEELQEEAARAREVLDGRKVVHVSSTARGGGVAEMLAALLPYANGAGVEACWEVIKGEPAFFDITKRIHNRLHGAEGDGGPLGEEERAAYEKALEPNAEELKEVVSEGDLVILHDPQTAGLIPTMKEIGAPVVWRCHVGLDTPNDNARDAWKFLLPYVEQADAYVFSRDAFMWEDLDEDRGRIIAPSIDVFAPKNQDMDDETIDAILTTAGLVAGPAGGSTEFTHMDGSTAEVTNQAEVVEEQPLTPEDRYVLQVSRWDTLKDPLGVINGFAEHVAPHSDAHLLYAGPAVGAVSDDPEGAEVLEHARERWKELPEDVRARVHLAMLPMDDLDENAAIVNALQRRATVVVQKSLAEGFGLTVAEAMWKGRPVVASRIGGIQDQIADGESGLLLDDPKDLEAYGKAVLSLLEDPERSEAMGKEARARVKDEFLGNHSLLDFLALLEPLTKR